MLAKQHRKLRSPEVVEVKKEELLKSKSQKKNNGIVKATKVKIGSKFNNTGKINSEVKVKLESDQQINIKLEPEEDLNIVKLESNDRSSSKSKHLVKKDSDPFFNFTPQAEQNSLFGTLNKVLENFKQTDTIPKPSSTRKPKLKTRPPNGTILNISDLNFEIPLAEQIEIDDLYFLHYALAYSKKTVMITGAGISVNSGIPDFRSAHGLFQGLATKNSGSGKNLFDYNVFRSNESIDKFEQMIEKLFYLSQSCQPSHYHKMINEIASQGRLLRLYTQNIDCLDVELPYLETEVPLSFKKDYPQSIQLHGSVKLLNCSKCNYITDLNEDYFKGRKFGDGKVIRACPECEEMNQVRKIAGKRNQSPGVLRPRIVLYNEFHPDGEIIGSVTEKDLKSRPDCLIVTGTTLKIPGVRRLVKEMAKVVHSNNGYVIWVNLDPPSQSIVDYVEHFDLIVVGDCQVIPGLVKLYEHLYLARKKKNASRKRKENDFRNTVNI